MPITRGCALQSLSNLARPTVEVKMAKIHQALWFRFLLLTILSSMAWAQLPVTDDTYVSSAAPTTNNGNSPSLVVQKSSNGTTLIRLDLSQLTAAGVSNTAVSKATLKLYTSAVTGQGTFDLYRIDSSWAEGTVTYNTSPAMALITAGAAACPGVQCVNTASKYVQVDITSLVQDWLAGGHANNGLALKPNATTISVTFEGKESTTTSHAPELDVVLNTSLAQLQGQITPAQVAPGTYNISITGNAATANSATTAGSATTASSAGVAGALALTPSQCGATLFATGIQANGNANCLGITNSHLPSSVVYNNQVNTFAAGFKQTFTANSTYAGLNIAGISVNNPTGLAAGDLWFRLDLKHLHFYDGLTTHQLMFRDDSLPESQVTNLTADLATQTTNLNNEIANRQAAVTAEALARAAGDAATLTSANTYTDNTKTNILTQPQTFSGNETLSGNNSFTGSNTFSGAKVDLSGAGATLPVQTTIGTVPTSGSANACVDGEMLMKVNGTPGQQLFICNAAHDGWVMVNDDTATASAANAYTDSKVATEAAARTAADATEATARIAADSAEALARAAGDAATLASANTYTDNTKTNILTQPQTFSGNETLSGNNSFTGSNTFSGAKVDLSGAGATLPVQTTTGTVPTSGSANACVDGEMLMKVNGTPGQQLFICNAAHDGWVMVNDDTATASAANAYTDSKVATEATARVAGDASTLSSANTFTSNAVAAEATLRAAGDAAAVASANAYTDGQVATINTSLAGKANLAGGNTFTGTQTLAPKTGSGAQASNSLQLNSTDGTTPQTAQLQARTDGGLSFQFGPTSGTPSEKASIDKNGVFTGNGSGLTNISGINVTNIPNSSLQNSSIGVVAGTGIGLTGTSSLGGSFTIANTGVLLFNGRNGLVTPQANDYSFAQLSGTDSATSNLLYNNQANTFTGGKQKLAVSTTTFASLNFPNTGAVPTTPVTGDLWLTASDGHLQFQSATG